MKRTSTVVARALSFGLRRTSLRACLPSYNCHIHVRHLSLRRRRGIIDSPTSEGGTSDGDATMTVNRPMRVMDTLEFAIAAQDLLEKIEKALEPMKKHNDIFVVHRDYNKLTLKIGFGDDEYTLEINEDSSTVTMQTPVSGRFSYVLCSSTKNWVDEEDGHILEGMLVRDLIKQCNGVPQF
jgi:frataxin-like iron-binding protein CyaY